MTKKFDSKSAIILGMHDAIVSLTGLIAGLFFAFTNTKIIVISCIISSITASLSMGAANYLAVKSKSPQNAWVAALHTFFAYMITCVLLILPFFVFQNRYIELISVIIIAIAIIFLFNFVFYRKERFYAHFFEMLCICAAVSIVAFVIGESANKLFGI